MGNSERLNRYNRSASFSAMDKEMRMQKWGKRFGNTQTAQHITSALMSYEKTEAQIEETIQFIISVFKSKGFSEEEAIKYMNANKRLITISKSRLGSILCLLDTVRLSDEVFFNQPSFLQNKSSIAKMYDAVRTVKASGEVDLDAIKKVLLVEDKAIEYPLTKDRLQLMYGAYMGNIKRLVKEQEEAKKETL